MKIWYIYTVELLAATKRNETAKYVVKNGAGNNSSERGDPDSGGQTMGL